MNKLPLAPARTHRRDDVTCNRTSTHAPAKTSLLLAHPLGAASLAKRSLSSRWGRLLLGLLLGTASCGEEAAHDTDSSMSGGPAGSADGENQSGGAGEMVNRPDAEPNASSPNASEGDTVAPETDMGAAPEPTATDDADAENDASPDDASDGSDTGAGGNGGSADEPDSDDTDSDSEDPASDEPDASDGGPQPEGESCVDQGGVCTSIGECLTTDGHPTPETLCEGVGITCCVPFETCGEPDIQCCMDGTTFRPACDSDGTFVCVVGDPC